jgi:hypothetical protein
MQAVLFDIAPRTPGLFVQVIAVLLGTALLRAGSRPVERLASIQ